MKILNYLFLALLVAVIFSCGDDDETVIMDSSELVGVWEAQSFDFSLESSTEFNGMTFSTSASGEGTSIDYVLTLTENEFMTSGEYTYDVNVVTNGQSAESSISLTDVSGDGTYTTLDDVITTNGAFFEFEFEGQDLSGLQGETSATFSLNGNTLTFTQNETISTEDQGVITTSVVQSTSTWTRQ